MTKGFSRVNQGKMKKNTSNNSNNNRNKIMMSKKKKRVNLISKIHEIIRYLKSDSYLYSHLIRANSTTHPCMLLHHHHHPNSGWDRNEGMVRMNEGEWKEKWVKYLKTDAYLYAPFADVARRDAVFVKNVISSPREEELQFTRVTSTILSRKIDWLSKQVAHDSMVDKHSDRGRSGSRDVHVISPATPELQNGKKQASRHSERLSTTAGTRVPLGVNGDLRKGRGWSRKSQ